MCRVSTLQLSLRLWSTRIRPLMATVAIAAGVICVTGNAVTGNAATGNAAAGTAAAVSEARARMWVERDARTLRHAAEALVTERLAVPFGNIEDRVPEYGDWVYGWLSSIVVSARVIGVGAQTAGGQVWRGEDIDSGKVVRDMEAYVADAFEEQVIKPETAEQELTEAWVGTLRQLERLDRRLAADRAERGAPAAYARPLLTGLEPGVPADLVTGSRAVAPDLSGEDMAHANLVLIRSARPLSVRLLSATTRLVIVPFVIPAVGGATAVATLDTSGFLGASLFSGTVAAGLWGVDYLINWVDRSWNQPSLEADLRQVIRAQRDRTTAGARAHLDAAFCRIEAVAPAC